MTTEKDRDILAARLEALRKKQGERAAKRKKVKPSGIDLRKERERIEREKPETAPVELPEPDLEPVGATDAAAESDRFVEPVRRNRAPVKPSGETDAAAESDRFVEPVTPVERREQIASEVAQQISQESNTPLTLEQRQTVITNRGKRVTLTDDDVAILHGFRNANELNEAIDRNLRARARREQIPLTDEERARLTFQTFQEIQLTAFAAQGGRGVGAGTRQRPFAPAPPKIQPFPRSPETPPRRTGPFRIQPAPDRPPLTPTGPQPLSPKGPQPLSPKGPRLPRRDGGRRQAPGKRPEIERPPITTPDRPPVTTPTTPGAPPRLDPGTDQDIDLRPVGDDIPDPQSDLGPTPAEELGAAENDDLGPAPNEEIGEFDDPFEDGDSVEEEIEKEGEQLGTMVDPRPGVRERPDFGPGPEPVGTPSREIAPVDTPALTPSVGALPQPEPVVSPEPEPAPTPAPEPQPEPDPAPTTEPVRDPGFTIIRPADELPTRRVITPVVVPAAGTLRSRPLLPGEQVRAVQFRQGPTVTKEADLARGDIRVIPESESKVPKDAPVTDVRVTKLSPRPVRRRRFDIGSLIATIGPTGAVTFEEDVGQRNVVRERLGR